MTTPSERALPPLPEPERRLYDPTKPNGRASSMDYTAEEMRAYAIAALATRAAPPAMTAPKRLTRLRRGSDGWYSDDGGLSWINPAPNAEPQVVGTTCTFQAIATTYPGTVCGTGLATRAAPPEPPADALTAEQRREIADALPKVGESENVWTCIRGSTLRALAQEARPAPAAQSEPACSWTEEDNDSGTWATGCGELFCISADTPAENGMKFCCYCGGALVTGEPGADHE